MLAPELRNYLDSLKGKANTISDEQLRGMIKVAGYGEETFSEAIDYFRSPTPTPAPASKPAAAPPADKHIVIPKSVLKEMTHQAKVMEPEVTTDRRPRLFQWVLLLLFGVLVPFGLLISLQRTSPWLFADAANLSEHLRDSNALLALVPALLISLAGILFSVVLGRRAYRKKGRPVISFLFGISLHILFLVAAYVGVQLTIAFLGSNIPLEGPFAIVRVVEFATSVYAVIFAASFIVGTFLLFLSYFSAVPLQESFQHPVGGQIRMILFALLVAGFLFNVAYFPALLLERKEGCLFIFDTQVRAHCVAQIETLESVRPETPVPLESPDDQYLRDVQAL